MTLAPNLILLSLVREYYIGLMMILTMMMTSAVYSVRTVMYCGKVSRVLRCSLIVIYNLSLVFESDKPLINLGYQ